MKKTDKKPQQPKKDPIKRLPQDFMAAALDFERSKSEDTEARSKIYKILGIVGLSIGVVGVITALVATLARKEPEPFVLKVDQSTGYTEVMRSVKDTSEHYDEVVNRYWLAQYVRTCESYDWFTISEQFEACKLMSDNDVAAEYSRNVQAPDSPLVLLKDKGKIKVKIVSIAFFGDTASVRYTKEKTNASGENMDRAPVQRKIATIAYQFKSGFMTDQQRLINPLGFKAASFSVNDEAQQ